MIESHWQAVIGRQFAAAIQMLRAAVESCPEDLWDDRTEGTPFWHLAYHALYYTDFYLSDDAGSFQPPEFHVDKAQLLPGDYEEYFGMVNTPKSGFTKPQLLDYAGHCLRKCEQTFSKLTGDRALERCGFAWYELNMGEFLLNNLRHTQHHTGQLVLLLRRRAGIGAPWLGTKDNHPPPPTW